jgi:hypothetical protein
MTNLMTESFVQQAVNSTEQFPIDFDDVWQGLGYSTKGNAVRTLENECMEGLDFLSNLIKSTGGRPSKQYRHNSKGYSL